MRKKIGVQQKKSLRRCVNVNTSNDMNNITLIPPELKIAIAARAAGDRALAALLEMVCAMLLEMQATLLAMFNAWRAGTLPMPPQPAAIPVPARVVTPTAKLPRARTAPRRITPRMPTTRPAQAPKAPRATRPRMPAPPPAIAPPPSPQPCVCVRLKIATSLPVSENRVHFVTK